MLRKSIIERPGDNYKPYHGYQLENETKMLPIAPKQPRQNKVFKMLHVYFEKIDESYSNEDSVEKSKKIKSKLDQVNILRATVSMSILFCGLCIYEYWSPYTTDLPYTAGVFFIVMFILTIIAVLLYLLSIFVHGLYLKYLNAIPKHANMFYYTGALEIAFNCILLLAQPIYFSPFRVNHFYESYWDGTEVQTFARHFNDYMHIVQFTFHFFLIINEWLKQSTWGSQIAFRVCRHARTKNGFHFILCVWGIEAPLPFAIVFLLVTWAYYSTVIRITESGLLRSFKYTDYPTVADYENAMQALSTFRDYPNNFWFSFITMATIGYGDISIQTTFSRVIVLFMSITGIIVVSLLVVVYGNYFSFSNNEKETYTFFRIMEVKTRMNDSAASVIQFTYRLNRAIQNNDYDSYRAIKTALTRHAEDLRLLRHDYYQLRSSRNQLSDVFSRVEVECDEILQDVAKGHPRANAFLKYEINQEKAIKRKNSISKKARKDSRRVDRKDSYYIR